MFNGCYIVQRRIQLGIESLVAGPAISLGSGFRRGSDESSPIGIGRLIIDWEKRWPQPAVRERASSSPASAT